MGVKILFVEDDERLRDILLEAAAMEGFDARGVSSAEAAVELLRDETFEVMVTDVTLPGMSGLDLLRHCQRLRPGILPIVITAYGTVDIAVEAMKRGATDFITKPFELDGLLGTIRVAAERAARTHAVTRGGTGLGPGNLIATAPVMQKLMEQVSAIAPFQTTVLLTGETGAGKEMVARAIHDLSPRGAKALVALNCAAVPEQLLEDELFGHVKGAFTGAQSARAGRFEQADGGTLFLDEIGDMSLPLQSKLLRVLQEREFEKLGSSRTVKVDVRVVAATSADLQRRIDEGTFRPDLYYRLNVVHLRLPPLRERREDIRPLAEHLLAKFCVGVGLPAKSVSEEAWDAFDLYRWPGNVRQLQNAVERAAVLTGAATEIQLQDLPEEVREAVAAGGAHGLATAAEPKQGQQPPDIPEGGVNFDAVVTKVERDLLLQSLAKAGGNKMRAAQLLGMKRTTFVEKLKRFGIEWEKETADPRQK
ncbi:MAG: two-component system, NtrC family, nitrogen regulation response regulator NtrX [Acidobacteriota bacterium]|jgi:DNA-binding NtrC family response regulator|nr:two-component system, NtrC family, nitrogen regulation response regulator NtrX [Acidobacteriota bacterium]